MSEVRLPVTEIDLPEPPGYRLPDYEAPSWLAGLEVVFHTVDSLDESFVPDPIGYFIVHATRSGLRLEHYTPDNLPTLVLTVGPQVPPEAQAEALRKEVLSRFPGIRTDHFGYLGQELGRAQACLDEEVPYVQR